MANTTDKSILTAAGKALLAQLNAEEKPLIIDKMMFANVPNRPEFPQPDDEVPTDNIVYQEQVDQRGRLSADSVIYSATLTSDVGPFEFNWTGAYCSEYGVLVTIDHHALTPKTVDEPGVAGNTLVRSVVLEYKDIAEITNITVDASSWQYNATDRMKKMDSDVAQSIIDQNGKDWFIEDGFLVTPSGSAYNIKAGAGYVSGNRVSMEFVRSVQVPNKPSFIYIDAYREGTPTGEQVTLFDFVVTAEEKDDYTDNNGVKHFICKIAQVIADGSVSDLRPESKSANLTAASQMDGKIQEQIANIAVWPSEARYSARVGDVIAYPTTSLRINGRLFALDKEIPTGTVISTINVQGGTVTAGGSQYLLGGGLGYGTVTAEGGTAFRKLSEMAADRINVRSFGAVESYDDVFIDATVAFQKAFDVARKKGRIVEAKGRFFISKHLRAYTAFDFSEATIVLPSDFDYGGGALEGAAIFIEEPDEQTIENFDLSGLYKGAGYHSSLVQFGVCTVFYESYTENAYMRNNGGDISYLKKQDILNCSSGYFQSTPSLYTINDPVKLTIKPIRERFTVYAPKWEIQGVPEVWAIPSLLSVKRNNVTVIGGYVNTFDVAAGTGRQPVNAFVRIIKSCFCNVTDMHTIGYAADFSYCVHLIGTYKTTIERCSDQKNWALVDGVTMRNTTCRDTVGSRIGSHYDAVDFYVYNHESTRSGIIVCGHGVLKIAGYRHTQLTSGGQNAISTRGDYAACWDGEVDISGVHIVFEGQVGSGAGLLKLSASKDGTESLEHEVRLPHTINIKDVTLEDKSPTGHNSSYSLLHYNIDWNQPTWLPTEINLRRIYETGHRNLRLGYSASLGVISHDNCVPVTTTYNMYGLENVTGNHDIFQQFEDSVAAKNKVIRNYFNHKGLRVVCNWPAGYELNIVDSDVNHIDGLFANNSNEAVCTIKNSRIHGQFMRWYSTGNGEMHLFNNTFKDPSELKISNAITICSSNVIPGGCAITGDAFTVEDFWQYKAPQYGKGFKSIRQGVAPNLNVMPLYLGEEYLQTVGGKAFWKAMSSTNNDEWVKLGGI